MDFSSRTDQLAKHYGLPLEKVAAKVGISPALLFACRSKKAEPSLKTLRALEQAEIAAGLRFPTSAASESGENPVKQDQGGYYGTPAMITRQQIEARVKAYLDEAERVPGGLGFAWGQVSTHMSPQSLVALRPGQYPDARARASEAKLDASARAKLEELKARVAASAQPHPDQQRNAS